MIRQFLLLAISCSSFLFLQACTDDNSDNPWQTPVTLKDSANLSASKAISNNNGDLVIVWEEQDTEQRVDQSLTDTHNLIAGHESHTHVEVYQRTNIFARSYDADSASWLAEIKLQAGFLRKVQLGERTQDANNVDQLFVTGNTALYFSTHLTMATNPSGDAVAAWIQLDESATSGDAAATYDINVKHYSSATKTWGDLEKVTVNQALVLADLQLSLADDGIAQLLWLARDLSPDLTLNPKRKGVVKVYASLYDSTADSPSWSNETKVTEGTAVKSVQVSMYNKDTGIAVWAQYNSAAKSTFQGTGIDPCIADTTLCDSTQLNLYGQWFNASGWQDSPQLISNAKGEVGYFKLAGNNDQVWLIWEQNADRITSARDPNNNVIYPRTISDTSQIMVSQFDTTVHTWNTATALQADDTDTAKDEGIQHAIQPDLAVDDQGNVVAVWIQQVVYSRPVDNAFIGVWNNNVRQTVWINAFTNSKWSGAKLLDSDDQFSNERPHILATSTNNFVAVWLQWTSLFQSYGHSIYSIDYNASTSMAGTKYKVASKADIVQDIYLAKDKANQVQVVWTGDDTAIRSNAK